MKRDIQCTSAGGASAPSQLSVRNPPARTPYAITLMLCSLHSETNPDCSGLLSRREYCTYTCAGKERVGRLYHYSTNQMQSSIYIGNNMD